MTTPADPEARYAGTVERVYQNDVIEVTWEPRLCVHFGMCIQGSRRAFDPRRRPWVDINAEPAERLAAIIGQCPTGALHAHWRTGAPAETPPDPAIIVPLQDGPLILHGRVQVLARNGDVIRDDTRVALCRCGHSQNKPFCDDSHYRVGFRSADPHLDGEHHDHERNA
jgi:CDGSH-type Zn-finger protein/uncharacterized Fe-S cluster protein YjdI